MGLQEGFSVRGLTTAASIWMTSAIGILSFFRWVESKVPSHHYSHHAIGFARSNVMPEAELRDYLANKGFTVANMSYRASDDMETFEYRMVIRTSKPENLADLAVGLRQLEGVRSFRISPDG